MKPHIIFVYIVYFYSSSVILVTCESSQENEFSLARLTKDGINFVDIVKKVKAENINISAQCQKQLLVLLDHPNGLLRSSIARMGLDVCFVSYPEIQAITQPDIKILVADAWSKFPYPGAFYVATRSDWANYDECIRIDVQNEESTRVIGKFCTWGLIIPDLTSSKPEEDAWKLSTCIPDKCTAQDLINITGLPIFDDALCTTKETDREIDIGAIIAIVAVVLVVNCMIISTIYDVYLHYSHKKSGHILYTAFSVYSNGKKLLAVTKHSNEQILCFHGMKFISMWWIISGHGMVSLSWLPLEIEETRATWNLKRVSQYMTTAHISVETFFYISGFLMAYLYFKGNSSKKSVMAQLKDIPSMIIHRYLRLTPANGMCFLVSVYLLKYFNNGPTYSYQTQTIIIEPCKNYWWTFFLYIQNYYNFYYGENLCIPTTWYLSADMQLFIIAPLVIIPLSSLYRRSFKTAMSALFGLNIVFFALPILTKLTWQDYDPDLREFDSHGRLVSYFIGVMMGLYMRHERNKTLTIKTWVNILLWFLALSTMYSVMWYRSEIQIYYGYVARSLCYSFTKPMWCIALCWITYACVKGYGGVVNWLLSSHFMQLGGKLTYCLYIVHGIVIGNYMWAAKYRFYFNDWQAFYLNCGHFIVSMLVATFWTLAFKLPMITVEKIIFRSGKRQTPKLKTDVGHDNPQKVQE